ncbi:MAG: hemolysin family protein [Oligosphaeraceae bacterium]
MGRFLPILLGILALLGCSAFFSSAETALMSMSKAQLRRLKNDDARGRMVYRLLTDSQRMMGAILLGNLFVNTLLAALTADVLGHHLSSPRMGALLSILLVTPTLVLAGELLPKINGLRHNLAIARFAAPLILLLSYLLAPLLWMLNGVSRGVQRLFGLGGGNHSWESLTSAELVATIDSAASAGEATSREHDLLGRILRFGTIQAKEIMLPRPQIQGLDDSLTLRDAFPLAQKSDLGVLPVFQGNLDEIWGALSFADLLKYRDSSLGDRPLASFRRPLEEGSRDTPLTPVEFVPGTARIDHLLEQMRKGSLRLAIIVSEYGGTLGMVTPSMILEEVVGRYAFSGRDVNHLQKRNGGFLADGRARLRMVEDALGCAFPGAEAETLAGFVMERLGRIPAPGDQFYEEGLRFQVVRTAGRLASAVMIYPPQGPEEDESEDAPAPHAPGRAGRKEEIP